MYLLEVGHRFGYKDSLVGDKCCDWEINRTQDTKYGSLLNQKCFQGRIVFEQNLKLGIINQQVKGSGKDKVMSQSRPH